MIAGNQQAWSQEYFEGFYVGLEGGAISYNTQITFDGVDDPAGRGGLGYGGYIGYNFTYPNLVFGTELLFNLASIPDPYTFDPAIAGFSELDLRRGALLGLNLRPGYVVAQRFLLFASIGYVSNEQSVRIDGVELGQIEGGSGVKKFGAFQFGFGLEFGASDKLGIRVSFRKQKGHDLEAGDFGALIPAAALTHFDVEPEQLQFFIGVWYRIGAGRL